MRKRMTYSLIALLGGVAVTPPLLAGSAAADDAIHLTEKFVKVDQIDVGRHGPSRGDSIVYSSVLLDPAGKRIGRGGGQCVSVRPTGGGLGLTTCMSSLELTDGQISYMGLYDATTKRGTMPVVGGTGAYRGRSGELAWATKDDVSYVETIRLD